MVTNKDGLTIKARRWYLTRPTPAVGGFSARGGDIVRVTGFDRVGNETWCAIRFEGDRAARLMIHADMIARAIS